MNRNEFLQQLRSAAPVIAPSMLKCDFGNLQREVELLERAGAQLLHLDVMDGHFVPNLSYGPMVIERLRPLTQLPFDAHLMVSDPARYLDDYLDAGCDAVTFHIEAVDDARPLLERIRSADAAAGLALNPGTEPERLEPLLSACDLVLVMSVEPGFGGQQFIPDSLRKLRMLRERCGLETVLSIDGGINVETVAGAAAAGAGVLVAGSAVFDCDDYGVGLEDLVTRARASAPEGVV